MNHKARIFAPLLFSEAESLAASRVVPVNEFVELRLKPQILRFRRRLLVLSTTYWGEAPNIALQNALHPTPYLV